MFKSVAITNLSGLGNILTVFSKAYLTSKAFRCPLYLPFPYDAPRKKVYWNFLKSNPICYPSLGGKYRLKLRNEIRFKKEDYYEIHYRTGIFDYGIALKHFCDSNNIKSGSLISEGGWGWFYAIERAKEWVRGILYADKKTRNNITEIGYMKNPHKLTICFHIRRGDFKKMNKNDQWIPGSFFSRTIPIEWLLSIGNRLKTHFGNSVEFIVVSDSNSKEIQEFVHRFKSITTFNQNYNCYSDLLILSQSDLLVCSNSTYSLWAAFLSNSPYIFFSPGLRKNKWGYYLTEPPLAKDRSSFYNRGYVLSPHEDISSKFLCILTERLRQKQNWNSDLIRTGYYPNITFPRSL